MKFINCKCAHNNIAFRMKQMKDQLIKFIFEMDQTSNTLNLTLSFKSFFKLLHTLNIYAATVLSAC